MTCDIVWSNIDQIWSGEYFTWSTLGRRATDHDIWYHIADRWICFQDTWGQRSSPPIPSVVPEEGYNIAMGEIPHVEILPYELELPKKKRKKTIELILTVGTEEFKMKKDTREENNVSFDISKIKLEVKKLHEAQLSIITL